MPIGFPLEGLRHFFGYFGNTSTTLVNLCNVCSIPHISDAEKNIVVPALVPLTFNRNGRVSNLRVLKFAVQVLHFFGQFDTLPLCLLEQSRNVVEFRLRKEKQDS